MVPEFGPRRCTPSQSEVQITQTPLPYTNRPFLSVLLLANMFFNSSHRPSEHLSSLHLFLNWWLTRRGKIVRHTQGVPVRCHIVLHLLTKMNLRGRIRNHPSFRWPPVTIQSEYRIRSLVPAIRYSWFREHSQINNVICVRFDHLRTWAMGLWGPASPLLSTF